MTRGLADLAAKLGNPAYALERQHRMNSDVEFLQSHADEWRREYPDRWIAVYGGELIAVADSQEALVSAVEARQVPLAEVVFDFLSEQRVAYLL